MYSINTRALCVALAYFASPVAADTLPPAEQLAGIWLDYPVVNGQQGSFMIGLSLDAEGGLDASLSLPPIDVWHLPVGKAELLTDGIKLGSTKFEYNESNQSLNGTISAAILPVYTVSVSLKLSIHPPQPGPEKKFGSPAKPTWVFDTGAAVWSSPVVARGTVFIGSDDGKLYALDAEHGNTAWSFATGGAVRSKPVLSENHIFVQSDDGYLYNVDTNGDQVWNVQLYDDPSLRASSGSPNPKYLYSSAVTAHDGKLYTGTLSGDVVALDQQTGDELWRFSADEAVQGTPVVANGRVIFGSFDHHVYALDIRNGEMLWYVDTGAPVTSTPAIAKDLVIIGSRSYDLFGLDVLSGERHWRNYFWYSWVESSATVVGDDAYIGSSDAGHVMSLDVQTGRRNWVFDTSGSAWGTPAVDDRTIFIGAVGVRNYVTDHQPGFFAVDRVSGKLRWSFLTVPGDEELSGFASSPAVDDKRVIVGSLDGRVYAFEKRQPVKD